VCDNPKCLEVIRQLQDAVMLLNQGIVWGANGWQPQFVPQATERWNRAIRDAGGPLPVGDDIVN
jgi:hypothetical protein